MGTVNHATLLVAVIGVLVFFVVLLAEGATRVGYDPRYHTGSELELGPRGWVQRGNFLLVALGMFAFAIGIRRSLGTTGAAVFVVIAGFSLVAAGLFAPDPVRGYPPGAPVDPGARRSWKAAIHEVTGPVAVLSLFGACLAVAPHLQGPWRWYTLTTALLGLALLVGTMVAFRRDAATTGIVQRALILVYFGWVAAVAVHMLDIT